MHKKSLLWNLKLGDVTLFESLNSSLAHCTVCYLEIKLYNYGTRKLISHLSSHPAYEVEYARLKELEEDQANGAEPEIISQGLFTPLYLLLILLF
jgi:hypothetical protein